MNILNLPSGSTKFAGIIAAAQGILDKGYKPDIVTGISAGAIATIPIALNDKNLLNKVINKALTLSLDDLFSIKPINKRGKIRITRALLKHGSLGEQRVDKLLKEFITEDIFKLYKEGNYPTCLIQSINIDTSEPKIWNLKELDYNTYVKAVAASSAIPIYTQAIYINGEKHYDGGLRDTILTQYVIKNYDVKNIKTIYSTSEDYVKVKAIRNRKCKLKMLLPTATNMIEILLDETVNNESLLERLVCKKKGINLEQYYLPKVLTSLYDVDNQRLKLLYNLSYGLKPKL